MDNEKVVIMSSIYKSQQKAERGSIQNQKAFCEDSLSAHYGNFSPERLQ